MDTLQDPVLKQVRRTARAEASAWIVRLHGPHRNAELEAGFRDWLAASPENARQFERVTEVWEAGATPVPGMPRLAPEEEVAPGRRWLLAAALATISIVAGGWGVYKLWLNPSYSTDIGEQRIVRLSDGSRVTLNSDSQIAVAYRRSERRVSVDRGEAFFEVAKDPSRTFRVRAGDHQIEALGTSFLVRRDAKQLMVSLIEGKIAVSSLDDEGSDSSSQHGPSTQEPRAERVTLEPGQRLRVPAIDKKATIDVPRMDAVTAWRRGEVVLDKTALADAVAEMNRYDRRRLVIDDAEIAGIKVSGIYHTGDSEVFAQMVSRLYGLEVGERDGEIHLSLSPDAGSAAE